ncbi:hypothetical protein A176_005598 [Myxococcus hansupus]|uniref:Uncharacterized protein n=1 Tax=Pseudomyxococcus hansupus TaxID=1297742 RepID=A0A0H4WZ09_9BACT|nr:hypothetical protein [Myxococcus hansupus]AKQ68686.1 hypothetical protein A176_005598 [Myxococcus hansupus]
MTAQSSKKPLLRKETLRQLDTAELNQLDGAVGGITPTVIVLTRPVVELTTRILEK